MEENVLVNRVANSGLITLNLEDYFPSEEVMVFDVKNYLFMELMLKEKDFREALSQHDWTQYDQKNLAITCSADAIVPYWAYMLVAIQAQPHAKRIFFGTKEQFYEAAMQSVIADLDVSNYRDQRVVIKGCSRVPMPISAYVSIAAKLAPIAKSLMYGEPCSTVPLMKRKG